MRHRVKTVKLQRKTAHRRSMLANLTCSLIEHGRIRTTVAKAKALRPIAERMVTLGKRGDLHARRLAVAFLHQKVVVKKLFAEVAPAAAARRGGYCRITKLGPRPSDAAPMAFIEWVDRLGAEAAVAEPPASSKAAAAAAPAAAAAAPPEPAVVEPEPGATPAEPEAIEVETAEEPASDEAASESEDK